MLSEIWLYLLLNFMAVLHICICRCSRLSNIKEFKYYQYRCSIQNYTEEKVSLLFFLNINRNWCQFSFLHSKFLCVQKWAGKSPYFHLTFTFFFYSYCVMEMSWKYEHHCYYYYLWRFNYFKPNEWEILLFNWIDYITKIHGSWACLALCSYYIPG